MNYIYLFCVSVTVAHTREEVGHPVVNTGDSFASLLVELLLRESAESSCSVQPGVADAQICAPHQGLLNGFFDSTDHHADRDSIGRDFDLEMMTEASSHEFIVIRRQSFCDSSERSETGVIVETFFECDSIFWCFAREVLLAELDEDSSSIVWDTEISVLTIVIDNQDASRTHCLSEFFVFVLRERII